MCVCEQQVWTGQQYVGGQQMMQLQLAAQQQQQQQSGSSAVGTAQELYANGYQDLAATTSAAKQMASTRDRPSGTDFRLDTTLVMFQIFWRFWFLFHLLVSFLAKLSIVC